MRPVSESSALPVTSLHRKLTNSHNVTRVLSGNRPAIAEAPESFAFSQTKVRELSPKAQLAIYIIGDPETLYVG